MGLDSDEFVTQAREHLTVLEHIFLSLEKLDDGRDVRERIDRCLRIVHSIKGDAGFLGYTSIRARQRDRDGPGSNAERGEWSPLRPSSGSWRPAPSGDPRGRSREQRQCGPQGTPLQLEQVEQSMRAASGRWTSTSARWTARRSSHLAEFFAAFAISAR